MLSSTRRSILSHAAVSKRLSATRNMGLHQQHKTRQFMMNKQQQTTFNNSFPFQPINSLNLRFVSSQKSSNTPTTLSDAHAVINQLKEENQRLLAQNQQLQKDLIQQQIQPIKTSVFATLRRKLLVYIVLPSVLAIPSLYYYFYKLPQDWAEFKQNAHILFVDKPRQKFDQASEKYKSLKQEALVRRQKATEKYTDVKEKATEKYTNVKEKYTNVKEKYTSLKDKYTNTKEKYQNIKQDDDVLPVIAEASTVLNDATTVASRFIDKLDSKRQQQDVYINNQSDDELSSTERLPLSTKIVEALHIPTQHPTLKAAKESYKAVFSRGNKHSDEQHTIIEQQQSEDKQAV